MRATHARADPLTCVRLPFGRRRLLRPRGRAADRRNIVLVLSTFTELTTEYAVKGEGADWRLPKLVNLAALQGLAREVEHLTRLLRERLVSDEVDAIRKEFKRATGQMVESADVARLLRETVLRPECLD